MMAQPVRRTVVADDGVALRLAMYVGDGCVVEVALSPMQALSLASELLVVAHRRLAAEAPSLPASRRRRGGDPRHGERSARDEAVCDLARLLGADLSLEQQAAAIVGKAERYRPAASDPQASPERQALYRIASAGLPLPGRRQLRRIIVAGAGRPSAKQKSRLDGQGRSPVAGT